MRHPTANFPPTAANAYGRRGGESHKTLTQLAQAAALGEDGPPSAIKRRRAQLERAAFADEAVLWLTALGASPSIVALSCHSEPTGALLSPLSAQADSDGENESGTDPHGPFEHV